MNRTFQAIGFFGHVWFHLFLTLFAPTKWLTQTFVDCSGFNKGEINEVHIEWTLKSIQE